MADETETFERDERAAELESEAIAVMEELVTEFSYDEEDLRRLTDAALRLA